MGQNIFFQFFFYFVRLHPHNLVGIDCVDGVCVKEEKGTDVKFVFNQVGTQSVKKRDVDKSLKARCSAIKWQAPNNFASSFDLNAIRLCFQVSVKDPKSQEFSLLLGRIFSDVIYNKKSRMPMTIMKLSHREATCDGGQEMILLCDTVSEVAIIKVDHFKITFIKQVAKDDVLIRFYDDEDWENFGKFNSLDVHKQAAIFFQTPPYKTREISKPVKVKIEIKRISDGEVSEALLFVMLPMRVETPKIQQEPDNIPTVGSTMKIPQSPRLLLNSHTTSYSWQYSPQTPNWSPNSPQTPNSWLDFPLTPNSWLDSPLTPNSMSDSPNFDQSNLYQVQMDTLLKQKSFCNTFEKNSEIKSPCKNMQLNIPIQESTNTNNDNKKFSLFGIESKIFCTSTAAIRVPSVVNGDRMTPKSRDALDKALEGLFDEDMLRTLSDVSMQSNSKIVSAQDE